jgi:hypothetical protein
VVRTGTILRTFHVSTNQWAEGPGWKYPIHVATLPMKLGDGEK